MFVLDGICVAGESPVKINEGLSDLQRSTVCAEHGLSGGIAGRVLVLQLVGSCAGSPIIRVNRVRIFNVLRLFSRRPDFSGQKSPTSSTRGRKDTSAKPIGYCGGIAGV